MDANIIKIRPFDKLMFCVFDFLIPFASLYQLMIAVNMATKQSIPRGILPVVLLVTLAISMLAVMQRRRECDQCLVMEENVLHICENKNNGLSVIKTIFVQQGSKFVARGARGVFIEQEGKKTRVISHSPSLFMLIWSILFVANLWTILFIIKTPYESNDYCTKLNNYYNIEYATKIKSLNTFASVFLDILRMGVLGLFIFYATCVLLFIFSKISVFF